jgi:hypothetical protein
LDRDPEKRRTFREVVEGAIFAEGKELDERTRQKEGTERGRRRVLWMFSRIENVGRNSVSHSEVGN